MANKKLRYMPKTNVKGLAVRYFRKKPPYKPDVKYFACVQSAHKQNKINKFGKLFKGEK